MHSNIDSNAFANRQGDDRSSSPLAVPDFASVLDQDWFKRNPKRTHRVRPALAHEIPEATSPTARWFVVVQQLAPGVRQRQPFEFVGPVEEAARWNVSALTDHDAHAIFDLMHEAAKRGGGTVPVGAAIARSAMLGNGGCA